MKLPLFALCLACTLPLSATAQSYSSPRIVTGQPVLAFSGPYVGVVLDRGAGDLMTNGASRDTFQSAYGSARLGDLSGLGAGLRGGFDIRSGNMIYGGLLDIKRTWYEDSVRRALSTGGTVNWNLAIDQTAMIAVRVGYDMGGVMMYGLVGYSWMDASLKAGTATYEDTISAATFGGGFETQLGFNMSGYLELRMTKGDFEVADITADTDFSNIAVGVNYRF